MAETGKPEDTRSEGEWRDYIPEFLTELARPGSFSYEQRISVQKRSERIRAFVEDEKPWSIDAFLSILEDSDARYGYRSSPSKSIDLITKGSPAGFERLQIEWRNLYRNAGSDDSFLTPQGFARILEAFHNFGLAYHSELLSNLYPRRFWQLNGQVDRFYRMFSPGIPAGFSQQEKRYFIVKPLIDEVVSVLEMDLGNADYRIADHFIYWLMNVKKIQTDKPKEQTAFWKIAPGEKGWQWDECRLGGFIAVAWDKMGDLSGLTHEQFKKRLALVRPDPPEKGWTDSSAEQVWKFVSSIKPGDRIVANRGTTEVLGIGTIIGPYEFVPGVRHGHRRSVQWDDTSLRSVDEPGWRRTLVSITGKKFRDILAIKPQESLETAEPATNLITPETPAAGSAGYPSAPVYALEMCCFDLSIPVETVEGWKKALERKKQAVLYGPPGTGKTFVAEALARHLISATDGFWKLVQFHPAYTYEDFIQGIRPVMALGGLDYPTVPGRFVEFCEQARTRSGPCVLIIDEINRANLARVFGELLYLLEYRDREVNLSVDGSPFRIPSNVRLIGTMNTADRSIALVDHALRRRFAFIHLKPDYEALRRWHARNTGFDVEPLISQLNKLNRAIGDQNYEIGGSFFFLEDPSSTLESVWRMEIEPYLEEFFFDNLTRMTEFRWNEIGSSVLG